MHVAESRSTLCNKNVGPITLQPLVMYKWFALQSTVWLGHDAITTMGSLVVAKRVNLITFVGMSALLVIIQPTYVGLVSLYG